MVEFIRDPYTGKAIDVEKFVTDFINKNIAKEFYCVKNQDEYDIDLILLKRNDNQEIIAYIEVEGSNERSWNDQSKPSWPSGLMTMPLRKLKFFIKENDKMIAFLREKSTIEKDEFFALYSLNSSNYKFTPLLDKPRFWLKISNSGRYFCVTDTLNIVSMVNQIKPKSGYERNIWRNPRVTNKMGQIRSDQTLIVVGDIKTVDDGLVWGQFFNGDNKEQLDLINYSESKIGIKSR